MVLVARVMGVMSKLFGDRTQKALIFLAFLLVLIAVILRISQESTASPLSGQILERKFWNCFVSWHGCIAIAGVGAGSLLIGWRALREALARPDARSFGKAVLAVAGVNGVLGLVFFQTSFFTHAMWRWAPNDYMRVMGINLLISSIPTSIIMLSAQPSKLVPSLGLVRTTGLACLVLVVGYVFACLVYLASFGPVLVE